MFFFTTISKILHSTLSNEAKLLKIYESFLLAEAAITNAKELNKKIKPIDFDEDHYFDPTYNLNTDHTGALVCRKTHYFAPMEEFYCSYHYCMFCGQKLEAD